MYSEKKIPFSPIGFVSNTRQHVEDDYWGELISHITIEPTLPKTCLDGINMFSHIEIFFYFHQVDEKEVYFGSRHPRNNPQWPKMGIFAQRGKNRPNRLGHTIVRLLERKERTLTVEGLDAIDGTPILDIKPVVREFLPSEAIEQPEWVSELMQNYWKTDNQ